MILFRRKRFRILFQSLALAASLFLAAHHNAESALLSDGSPAGLYSQADRATGTPSLERPDDRPLLFQEGRQISTPGALSRSERDLRHRRSRVRRPDDRAAAPPLWRAFSAFTVVSPHTPLYLRI